MPNDRNVEQPYNDSGDSDMPAESLILTLTREFYEFIMLAEFLTSDSTESSILSSTSTPTDSTAYREFEFPHQPTSNAEFLTSDSTESSMLNSALTLVAPTDSTAYREFEFPHQPTDSTAYREFKFPHQRILHAISENGEGKLQQIPENMADLDGYTNTLMLYWNIEATTFAVYTLDGSCICTGRTKLVVCDKGVFQMNEAEDHVRFRGRDEKMVTRDWRCSFADSESDL